MSLLDPRQKTISLKVVYYGPGLGGKTTSLKQIHRVIDPEGRVKLVSLDTDEDRTLFFDFLPIELGLVGRFKIKIQGFTVPGQVKYNMTRRYVLTGADGIVFVADSDPSRVVENVESLINLGDNLRAHGLNVNNIPLVFQYNKQDLPSAVPPGELEEKLNFRKVPGFATVATRGDGIFDAFLAVSKLMVSRVIKTYNLKQEQADEERILREVENRLRSLGTEEVVTPPVEFFNRETTKPASAAAPAAAAPAAVPAAAPPVPDSTAQEADEFFGAFNGGASAEAAAPTPQKSHETKLTPDTEIRSPAADTEAAPTTEVPQAKIQPEATTRLEPMTEPPAPVPVPSEAAAEVSVGAPMVAATMTAPPPEPRPAPVDKTPTAEAQPSSAAPRDAVDLRNLLRSLREIGRGLAAGAPLEQSAAVILDASCQALEAIGASLLLVNAETGQLEGRLTNGYRSDPMLLAGTKAADRLLELLQAGGDQLLLGEGMNADLFALLSAVNPGVESAVAVPLVIGTEVRGALCVYMEEPLDLARRRDALKMLMVLAYQAAVGLRMGRPD